MLKTDAAPSTRRLLAGIAVVAGLAAIALLFLDRPVARFCWSLGPTVRAAARVVSAPASLPVAIAAVVALMILSYVNVRALKKTRRSQQVNVYVAGTAILSWGLTESLKAVFGRARPALLIEHGIYGFRFLSHEYDYSSFPSGHASFIFGVAVALASVRPKYRYPLLALAVVVSLSRVLACAHYASDVLVGGALGGVVAVALLHLFTKQGHDLQAGGG